LNLPRISVVTPSYNQAQFVEQTICSVLDQKYPNLEYIVIDGGSTDGSVEIIQRYAGQLTHWSSEKDDGQSDAINRGFEQATGDICCWINSDDYLEPNSLHIVANYFSKNQNWNVLNGGCRIVGHSTITPEVIGTVRRLECPGKHAVRRWPQYWFGQQSTFWRRSLWNRVGPLKKDLHFIMDLELWARFARETEIHSVPEILASYRLHDSAKCVADATSVALETLRFAITGMIESHSTMPPQTTEEIAALAYQQNSAWADLLDQLEVGPEPDELDTSPPTVPSGIRGRLSRLKQAVSRREH